MEQSFLHTHSSTVSLTSFWTGAVPDRQSPGRFPTSPGITRLRIARLAGALSPGAPEVPIFAQTGSHRHPGVTRPPSTSVCRIFPNRPLCAFTHNRVFTNMSGLSPYCCSTCPGFHRTAVLDVRAFTLLLFYSYLNHTQAGIPMDLPHYPLNTIPQHLYIDSNNTLYWLAKSSMCLSQDRSNN